MTRPRWMPLVTLFALLAFVAGWGVHYVLNWRAASESLRFLKDTKGASWYEIQGDQVYVGFEFPLPENWLEITEQAALAGNKATGREFNSWAVFGTRDAWRQKSRTSHTQCMVTARDSAILQRGTQTPPVVMPPYLSQPAPSVDRKVECEEEQPAAN